MGDVLAAVPNTSIQIQPATWRDFNAIREIEKLCFPLDAWPLWDIFGILALPGAVRLKAVDGEQLVGFVFGDIRNNQTMAWIASICVHPDYRGRGIGTALLTECESRLTVGRVRLSVRASNVTAIRLYEQHGYQQVGSWPHYYRGGEDAMVMEKVL